MSSTTARLIAEFEGLPVEEKQIFVKELFYRMPAFDSGPLHDEEVACAGDDLAAMLEKEENAALAR